MSIVAGVVGLLLLYLAKNQLANLTDQVKSGVEANKIGRLNALLGLEDSLANRRRNLSESAIDLEEIARVGEDSGVKSAQLRFDEAKQVYLNALDRLSWCLLTGILDEGELRAEYRETIRSTVKDFESDFGAGTDYRNIRKLYDKWVDS